MTQQKTEAENNFDVLTLFEGQQPHQEVRKFRRSEIIAEHLDGREAAEKNSARGRRKRQGIC